MSTAPFIPDSAPFTHEQRAWLNGFFAGVYSRQTVAGAGGPGPASPGPSAALQPLTILFGSQTGTAEGLAKQAAKEAGKQGFAATVVDMAQTDCTKLAAESNVLVITSTYGDGEPPDNAQALHHALQDEAAPSLDKLRFSVCGLGDTNYAQFCQCGKDFDAWLEKRGGTRVSPRADCDVDYEKKFASWLDAALSAFVGGAFLSAIARRATAERPDSSPGTSAAQESQDTPAPAEKTAGYSRANPFPAPVLAIRQLSGEDSAKEVNHVEISLEGSGLEYEAGDALGVYPQNCPELVNEILRVLECDGEEAVPASDANEVPLRRALTEFYELGKPTPDLIELMHATPVAGGGLSCDTSTVARRAKEEASAKHGDPGLPTTSGGPATVVPLDLLDVLATGTRPSPIDLVARLKKLQPRLYSISSSPNAHPGQVHLTVGAVRYEANGRSRKGVCSTFLPERASSVGRVRVFVHANKAFKLPTDGNVPVIMIGPGTGIAPFRAFLEERQETGARGRNWLFFGDQHAACDYLYRDEIEALHSKGLIARLDLAWSRDQKAKVYVQDRMRENAKEFFSWLEAGAHVYVCGDASRMAKDVDTALHDIVATVGGKTKEGAAAYVKALKAAKRYQRDVY